MKKIALLALAVALCGCANSNVITDVTKALPFLRPGAAIATSGFLLIDNSNRDRDIAALNSVSGELLSFQSSTVPTVSYLWQTITKYFPHQSVYLNYAGALVDLFAGIFPQVENNAALAKQAFGYIGNGIHDGISVFQMQNVSPETVKKARVQWAQLYQQRPLPARIAVYGP